METEYLEAVNKEIQEIESFFKQIYEKSQIFPSNSTPKPELLPFLSSKLISLPPTTTTTTTTTNPGIEKGDPILEESFAALQERYKQLKIVQDQLHIELTRFRIWKITSELSGAKPEAKSPDKPNAKSPDKPELEDPEVSNSKSSDSTYTNPSKFPDTEFFKTTKTSPKVTTTGGRDPSLVESFMSLGFFLLVAYWYFFYPAAPAEKPHPWPRR